MTPKLAFAQHNSFIKMVKPNRFFFFSVMNLFLSFQNQCLEMASTNIFLLLSRYFSNILANEMLNWAPQSYNNHDDKG